ncbi:tRNA (adenosine(37)-N6)-threonylcarbamoyltransferase complex ATPase subunit type 1 TsaE [Hyphococcus sp.]|uniref:tRNA (adenosine(37)-N6)-threonylcarbamoyltransferase complex ATPase subunit type 1 TsaE n=1 Tax=Hyphococcus sp. TaxID=2038636 RepID=UPI0037528A05
MQIAAVALADELATRVLGAGLAPVLRDGDIVCLEGDLGAGKSTIARAIIGALTDVSDAPSPTFTLVETYEADKFNLWHFDLYRLDAASDVWELGLEEALDNGVLLVEWPDRIAGLLPNSALTISLDLAGAARLAKISGDARWQERLHKAGIA